MAKVTSLLSVFCLLCLFSSMSSSVEADKKLGGTLPPIISLLLDSETQSVVQIRRKIISAGSFHTCMIIRLGEVICWGSNSPLTPGDEGYDVRLIPGVDTAIDIDSGQDITCVILANTEVACWGGGAENSLIRSADPIFLPDFDSDGNLDGARSVTVISNGFVCVSIEDGSVICYNDELGLAEPIFVDIERVVKFVATPFNNCALIEDGSVKCWGFASPYLGNGQFDQLDLTGSLRPFFDIVNVLNINNSAIDISAGSAHICALLSNFETRCWGDNTEGQLGNGESGFEPVTTSSIPVRPNWNSTIGVSRVVVSLFNSHTCALFLDGHVECMGRNHLGQLGNGEDGFGLISPNPVRVQNLGLQRITDITVNRNNYTCVSLENDQAKCWGDDNLFPDSQFEAGNSEAITTPTLVEGVPN